MRTHLLARTVKVHGRELSFNNLLDLDSGRRLSREFELPAAAIVKHNNPCGVRGRRDRRWRPTRRRSHAIPQSAFGGVVVLNREVDERLAERLNENFVELMFAPGYDDEALEILRAKPNMRIMEDSERRKEPGRARHAARERRPAAPGPRRRPRRSARHGGRHASASRPRRNGATCCSPGRSASTCARTRSCSRKDLATIGIGAGPDEPRRLGAPRGRQGRARTVPLEGVGDGLRRLLPVRRRARGRRSRPASRPIIQPGGSRATPR